MGNQEYCVVRPATCARSKRGSIRLECKHCGSTEMSLTGKVNAALFAAVVFLLLSSCAAYLSFARLRGSQNWVHHTREVQGALGEFARSLSRASRLRAEYIDSPDPSLLQRESEAVVKANNALRRIELLTAKSIAHQRRCQTLAELSGKRLVLMQQSIDGKRNGIFTPEAQAALTREIYANADQTDDVLQAMYDEEQDLLSDRQRRERASFNITAGILITSLFLALILFLVHHQLLTHQVRERARAESALRALSARLLTLQDEERRKFARELHDSVGQQLVAMKMGICSLEEKLPADPALQDCLKLVDETIAETRTISHLLHPPLLDEAGLKSALRWFVEGFGKRSGVQVQLNIDDAVERLPEPVELVLFRVLQESLTNVHRHSGASRADVSLSTSGKQVVLRIRDHGQGIPPAVLEKLHRNGTGVGVGLAGMTQRVREIGGNLEIDSSVYGTEIVASVPSVLRKSGAKTSSLAA